MIIIKDIEFICKDLPQLIVALDTDGNYIHIRDVKEDTDYYCPCCGGIVRPRAFKDDRDYMMQPHFYHLSGSCSEESRIHWLYKNWLFRKGSQFYIDKKLYTVDSVEIEKSYTTSFGIYRPDITVILDSGKVMFFEVNFTNSKTENDYFCKWSELNNDVVEVDIKKLMNEDFNCKIPSFTFVYSNGKCFKRKYQNRDDYANTIAKRKIEWKRQDKINYKIMWERLDWFWIKLQEFKNKNDNIEELLKSFKEISISDKEMCFDLLKRQSCVKKYNQKFREIINNEIKKYFTIENLQKSISLPINIKKVSAIEKQGYFIDYSIGSTFFNKKNYKNNLRHIMQTKEWILRYSNIQKIIMIINEEIKKCKLHEELQYRLYTDIYKIVLNIKNKYFEKEHCIWYFEVPEITNLKTIWKYTDKIDLCVGIKNDCDFWYAYRYCESFYISIYDIEGKTDNEIYQIIMEKIERKMRKIYKYISLDDGIGHKSRYVFCNKKEAVND